MFKKRLIGMILSVCLVLPMFCLTSYAIATPYKGMTPRELAELEQFRPNDVGIWSWEELDISQYAGQDCFEFYGVWVNAVELSREPSEYLESYTYTVYVDVSKQSVETAYDKLEASDFSIPYKGTTYGNGDIDASGSIDGYDYMCAKRIYFESYTASDLELGYADIDMDGEITVYDYLLIKRYYFGTYNPLDENE